MQVFLFVCMLAVAFGQKYKKTTLDDVERDNIRSEKSAKSVVVEKPKLPAPSPTQFGFVPIKTVNDYVRQEPKQIYYQPQYQFVPQQYTVKQHPHPQQYQQYQQYSQQVQLQYQPTQIQPQYQEVQPQYQQYENVQYVTDNNVGSQQYYTSPQYIYVQQYPSSSNAVQSVVDPKAGVQYVMYIPTTYTKQETNEQNYENQVVYENNPQYTKQDIQVQYSNIPSAEPAPQYEQKHEPKSLLDSYVPSILQIQYYKQQQQAQANALAQQNIKLSQTISGKGQIKTYKPQQESASNIVYRYQQVPNSGSYHP